MKKIILLLFIITFSKLYSQRIEKKSGTFNVTEIGYSFNEKNKKRKISKSIFYFDEHGKILEKIKYGRHHYNRLDIIGKIEQFHYDLDKLVLSKSYTSDCKSCDYYQFYTKYNYNKDKVLITENTYYSKNDSLFMQISYVNKSNIKETHFGQSTFYQFIYDSQKRLKQLNQVFEDTKEVRWQYIYEYVDSCRIGNFQTYYGDGKENSKKEIECFDSQKRLISKEIIGSYKTKTIYKYSKNGIIEQINEYESFGNTEYKLSYALKLNFKGKTKKLNSDTITKINAELIGE